MYLPLLVVKTEEPTLPPVGGKDTPMLGIHQVYGAHEEQFVLDLDEIARQGARKMLTQALEAEVEACLDGASDQGDEQGRALVVRNYCAREREVLLGAGAVEARAPRVNDRRTRMGSAGGSRA